MGIVAENAATPCPQDDITASRCVRRKQHRTNALPHVGRIGHRRGARRHAPSQVGRCSREKKGGERTRLSRGVDLGVARDEARAALLIALAPVHAGGLVDAVLAIAFGCGSSWACSGGAGRRSF